MNYYNEHDAEKAEWLRELIRRNVISEGQVDERGIEEVGAEDLREFQQCHFFAGIGVWSYALRLAGWPDDRPVWTGSCPCPSFSAAGKGGGFNDPRHLWPDWARLIRLGRPATIFGEQADDAIGYGWLDLVQTDLEREDYAVGKAVLTAAGVGAPHARERLYFVAHAAEMGLRGRRAGGESGESEAVERFGRFRDAGGMAHSEGERCGEARSSSGRQTERVSDSGEHGELADSECEQFRTERSGSAESTPTGVQGKKWERERVWNDSGKRSDGGGLVHALRPRLEGHNGHGSDGHESGWFGAQPDRSIAAAGYVNGFWRDADWVLRKRWNSEDFEWCPTEPGTFPLASGVAARVLKLRGYGDSIVAEVAKEFILASEF